MERRERPGRRHRVPPHAEGRGPVARGPRDRGVGRHVGAGAERRGGARERHPRRRPRAVRGPQLRPPRHGRPGGADLGADLDRRGRRPAVLLHPEPQPQGAGTSAATRGWRCRSWTATTRTARPTSAGGWWSAWTARPPSPQWTALAQKYIGAPFPMRNPTDRGVLRRGRQGPPPEAALRARGLRPGQASSRSRSFSTTLRRRAVAGTPSAFSMEAPVSFDRPIPFG